MASIESDPVGAPCGDACSLPSETHETTPQPSDTSAPAEASTAPQDPAPANASDAAPSLDAIDAPEETSEEPKAQKDEEQKEEQKEEQEEEPQKPQEPKESEQGEEAQEMEDTKETAKEEEPQESEPTTESEQTEDTEEEHKEPEPVEKEEEEQEQEKPQDEPQSDEETQEQTETKEAEKPQEPQHESPHALQVLPPVNTNEPSAVSAAHGAPPELPPSPTGVSSPNDGLLGTSDSATHTGTGSGSGGSRRRSPSEGKGPSVPRSTTVSRLQCNGGEHARSRAHSVGRNVSFHGTSSAGAALSGSSSSSSSDTATSSATGSTTTSPKSVLSTPPIVVRSPSPKVPTAGLTVVAAMPPPGTATTNAATATTVAVGISESAPAGTSSSTTTATTASSTGKPSRMKVPSLKLGTGHHRKHTSRSAGQSPPMSARVPTDADAGGKGLSASTGDAGAGADAGVVDDTVLDGLRTERSKERPKHLYATLHTSRRSNRYSMDPRLVQRPPELKASGLAQTMRPPRRTDKGQSQLDRLAETLAPPPLAPPGQYETFPFDEPDTPATIVVRRQVLAVEPDEGLAGAGAGAATEEADTLVAGTMPKIIAYITAPASQYLISVQARELAIKYFAACFKMHITPHALFTMLESRFLSARDRATDPRAASAAIEIQLNTLDIINEWVKCAFESDFKGDSLLLATVKSFLRSIKYDTPRPVRRPSDSDDDDSGDGDGDDDDDDDDDGDGDEGAAAAAAHRRPDTHAITRPVKKKAERVLEQFNLYESRSNIWANKAMGVIGESPETNPFLTSVAVDDSEVTLASSVLTIEPKEYAKQLALMEFYLFEKITPSELLSGAWTKKDAAERSPRIAAMTRFFNQKSKWAEQAILSCENDKKRHEMLKHFLKIAEALFDIADYNGMMIYLSAVNSSSITFVYHPSPPSHLTHAHATNTHSPPGTDA